MILADTDVLIDYLSDIEPVASQVTAHITAEILQTTAITCFELLSGAGENKRGDSARRLVAAISILPLDQAAAVRAATLRRQLEGEGFSIGMADSLIAGIALVNELPLLTRNRKHFEKIEGLRLVPVELRI